jgi:hypothetical protein
VLELNLEVVRDLVLVLNLEVVRDLVLNLEVELELTVIEQRASRARSN